VRRRNHPGAPRGDMGPAGTPLERAGAEKGRRQMANYLLAYFGGGMADDPAEQEAAMAAWMRWFGDLGEAVMDPGSPFGPSSSIGADGRVCGAGRAGLTGYSIVAADSLDAATSIAKGCPILGAGGSIEVYEVMPMG
jgi:YCII-related domain